MAATAAKSEQLKIAFEAFNRQSDQLEHSYRKLQSKVEILTGQLRESQSERLIDLIEKERLSQRLTHLLETLPGAVVVLDGTGIIREINSQASELLDTPLLGCSWAAIVKREFCAGRSEDGNLQLRDGRWLSLSRKPLTHEPGEILLLSDVTEGRQMSELRQRQQRLSLIGEMTAEFAHQVRTPLASAMLYAAQLDRSTAQQQKVAEKITDRLNDLGRMVNDMLGFAAGARPAEGTVNLRQLLTDVIAALEPQLNPATALQVKMSDESLQVDANGDALKGALMNLITNAQQACDGPAAICISARPIGGFVEISVADDGPGIPGDLLPRLFEPFFTTRPQGTGLGLAVVQAVVAAHDGEVGVESNGNGATFTIRIPIAADSNTECDDE